jgi:hypothetical protein
MNGRIIRTANAKAAQRCGDKLCEHYSHYASLTCHFKKGESMPTVLLVIVILLLLGALPTWPYSQGWGYYPSGGLGLLLIVLIIVALVGKR